MVMKQKTYFAYNDCVLWITLPKVIESKLLNWLFNPIVHIILTFKEILQ